MAMAGRSRNGCEPVAKMQYLRLPAPDESARVMRCPLEPEPPCGAQTRAANPLDGKENRHEKTPHHSVRGLT
jgi:hypothetical protein